MAIVQALMTQNITKTKTKQNVQIAIEARTKYGKEITALNTKDEKKGLNNCGNNCTLNYINGNNS